MQQQLVEAEIGDGSFLQIGIDELVEGDGVDCPEVLRAAVDLAADAADRGDRLELGHGGERLTDDGREALEAGVGDDVVRGDGALEGVDQRGSQR